MRLKGRQNAVPAAGVAGPGVAKAPSVLTTRMWRTNTTSSSAGATSGSPGASCAGPGGPAGCFGCGILGHEGEGLTPQQMEVEPRPARSKLTRSGARRALQA